jgi:putative ABC transport system permease protein
MLAVVGAALGVGGAYIALCAGYHTELDRLAPVPLAQLVLLGVGLPATAAIAGWLLGGREPPAYSRRLLE